MTDVSAVQSEVASKGQLILKYLKRYFGYSFWVGLEVVVFTGLPRLVIFPLVAYIIGKEEFGLFLLAFGIMMTIGKAPSAGLVVGVIRNLVDYDEAERIRFIDTSLVLCRIAGIVIIVIGVLVAIVCHFFTQTDIKIFYCLIPMGAIIYTWNLFELQMVRMRVERKFALRTGWYSLLAGLMFFGIPAAYFWGAIGMAWGVSFAFWASQLLLSLKQKILFRKALYDPKMAICLKSAWFHISFAMVLVLSSRYIYRIILGMSHGYSEISILYGATNMIDLCLAPMTILQLLLLSMFGRFRELHEVGRRQKCIVLTGAIIIVTFATAGLFWIGPLVLPMMFPEFAADSIKVMKMIIMILPCAAIIVFSNPFIVKFGQVKLIPVLNFITLIAHLIPALTLIPRLGIKGAVISYNIGYSISAAAWLSALIWTFKTKNKPLNQAQDS